MAVIAAALLILGIRFLDRWHIGRSEARARSRWLREGCYYRETALREVAHTSPGWEVIEQDSGDIDILPMGEDHSRGPDCICNPKVTIYGARIMASHNSFDHREIVEEAVNIINGVQDAESG